MDNLIEHTGQLPQPPASVQERATASLPAHSGYGRTEAGKYFVPSAQEEWNTLAGQVAAYVRAQQLVPPIPLDEIRQHAAALAGASGLGAHYREFLMILLHNEIWRDIVASIPFRRRMLLLPPCLRASGRCTAEFDQLGLICNRCGSCAIGLLSDEADALGYAVVVAEGTNIVADLIRQGLVDALIGVSCMPSLERTFPHIFTKAIPGLAIPLMKEGCDHTVANLDSVRRAMHLAPDGTGARFTDLKRLHRDVDSWFTSESLRAVFTVGPSEIERIAFDWLALSGKRWRPFLTVAVYEALRTDPGQPLPDFVKRIGIALECIHKASLIYDDIQDNDNMRYGQSTVHHTQGVPVALTAGLYLLGLGYRLIATCGDTPARCAAMLAIVAEGHCELCLGQGAELLWMRKSAPLTPAEVLDFFRWKTAPSFEVVFRLGALAGNAGEAEHEAIKRYSQAMGVAYQVQDDLQDFRSGGEADDIRSGRPSIVMAMAYEAASGETRERIARTWCGEDRARKPDAICDMIGELHVEADTQKLLDSYKAEAITALRPIKNPSLKVLLHRLVSVIFRDRQHDQGDATPGNQT
jgi:geranylgeranyl pyrophosphate synthase